MDFLCNECAKSFAKEVDLVVHQLRAHDKRPFSCPVCKENFIGKDTQRNHMRKHNKKKETTKKNLTCSSCTYETPHKQNLNRHVKTHDNEKVNGASMFCPECGKSFPAKRNLTRHLKIHQRPETPFGKWLLHTNVQEYFQIVWRTRGSKSTWGAWVDGYSLDCYDY